MRLSLLTVLISVAVLVPISPGDAADESRRQVHAIAQAAQAGDQQAVERIAFELRSIDPLVRAASITGLGQTWPVGAQHLDAVRDALDDLDPPVRQAALRYAGKVNDDTAIPAAIRAMGAIEPATKEAAHMTLVALARADKGTDPAAWKAWAEAREAVVEPLLARTDAAVRKGDPAEICQSVQALLFLRDRPATVGQVLLTLVDHPDQRVSQLALGALGVVEQPEVLAALARDRRLLDRVLAARAPEMTGPLATPVSAAIPVGTPADQGGSDWTIVVVTAVLLGALAAWFWPRRPAAGAAANPAAPAAKSRVTF
jgi:HEAT repeat protein